MNIHCIENLFAVHDFWATCACPEKSELPWNFSLYWIYFLHSGFLSNFVLAPKNRVALIFFTVFEHVFLSFSIFEQLVLALKNRVALKFFAVWNMLFTFWIFEQLALALKNRGFPEFSVPNIYYYSGILNNLRLLWQKQKVSWIHCIECIFFLLFRIFEQLALGLKNRVYPEIFHCIEILFYHPGFLSHQRLPWNFSNPGGRPPLPTPASYAYVLFV